MLTWSHRDASQAADEVEYFPMEMENVSDTFLFVTLYKKKMVSGSTKPNYSYAGRGWSVILLIIFKNWGNKSMSSIGVYSHHWLKKILRNYLHFLPCLCSELQSPICKQIRSYGIYLAEAYVQLLLG